MEEFRGIFEDILMEDKGSFIKREHEIVELLINQSLYPYHELKSIALENIYLMFRDSQTMAKKIDNLQIIEDNHSMKELDALEEISHYLFRLGETMEVWYTSDSKEKIKQLTLLLRRLEINMHKIEVDEEEIENCDQENEVKKILLNNAFIKNHLNRTFENLSKFNQDLCRNTQCLKYMIDIMADCMHLDTKFNVTPEKVNIVYMINLIIAESCNQNKKNKEYLSQYLEPLFL